MKIIQKDKPNWRQHKYLVKARLELKNHCMGLIASGIHEKYDFIEGYQDKYIITISGDLYSLPRLRGARRGLLKIKPGKDKQGYLYVGMPGRKWKIHQLVAKTFIKNVHGKPCINHKDGNKLNNHKNNLEWVTHSENNKHAYTLGLKKISESGKERIRQIKISERTLTPAISQVIIKMREAEGFSYEDLAIKFKTSAMTVWRVVNRYSKGLSANK